MTSQLVVKCLNQLQHCVPRNDTDGKTKVLGDKPAPLLLVTP